MSNKSSVFQDGNEWFFWDETWTQFLGPFTSEEEAERASQEYANYLTSGLYPAMLQDKEWKDGE